MIMPWLMSASQRLASHNFVFPPTLPGLAFAFSGSSPCGTLVCSAGWSWWCPGCGSSVSHGGSGLSSSYLGLAAAISGFSLRRCACALCGVGWGSWAGKYIHVVRNSAPVLNACASPAHNVFSMSIAAAGTGWWLRSLRIRSACALRTCPRKLEVEQEPQLCLLHPSQLICQLNGSTDRVLQQALMQCVAACLQWLPVPVPLGARIGRDGLLAAR